MFDRDLAAVNVGFVLEAWQQAKAMLGSSGTRRWQSRMAHASSGASYCVGRGPVRSASVHTPSHPQAYEPTQGGSDTGRPSCAAQVIYRKASLLSDVPGGYEAAARYARYSTPLS